MKLISLKRVSESCSGSLKTKSLNLNWLGIFVIALTFTMGGAAVEAQQPKKVPVIGYLSSDDPASNLAQAEGLREALRERGYIEGQNITTAYRYAEGNQDRLIEFAAELARLKVDVILTAGGNRIIQAAKNSSKTIPIVMMGGGSDPVSAGFIESLARPGGNITGVSALISELGGKRLDLFKEALPKLSRVAALYDPASQAPAQEVKEVLPPAARALKLTVQTWELRDIDVFENVFAALTKQRPDGIYALQGRLVTGQEKRIAGLALKSRLPLLGSSRAMVNAGGLMYYGADQAERYRRVTYYVDRILKGAKPAELPVEQPTKFELMFNLKTAKQIGVVIPQSLLYRADKVIR